MWWLAEPQAIHQVSDRVSFIYVERCHVDRDENAVVLVNRERTVRVPAALTATVLLGPGTRITHAAMRLLADSGTCLCWVGEQGVRMYAAGLGPSRSSHILLKQAALVSSNSSRLTVARSMYEQRFPDEDVSTATMQQLRGREGARVRRIYREQSQDWGVPWAKRSYKAGDAFAAGDDINRALSAAHSCLYGLCHAAIVGLGASPALGFVHTGSALAFVHDIADLYKADTSIPVAFRCVADGHADEPDVRRAMRDLFAAERLLPQVVSDIKRHLGEPEGSTMEFNRLWDEFLGSVAGGANWSHDEARSYAETGFVSFSGPEVDTEVPF